MLTQYLSDSREVSWPDNISYEILLCRAEWLWRKCVHMQRKIDAYIRLLQSPCSWDLKCGCDELGILCIKGINNFAISSKLILYNWLTSCYFFGARTCEYCSLIFMFKQMLEYSFWAARCIASWKVLYDESESVYEHQLEDF